MRKKKVSKKSKKKEKNPPDGRAGLAPEIDPKPENAFDFGGLPDRDLKKNLGCG
jgi:hypothetical protein